MKKNTLHSVTRLNDNNMLSFKFMESKGWNNRELRSAINLIQQTLRHNLILSDGFFFSKPLCQ